MLIGITGSVCSGKRTAAQIIARIKNFQLIEIVSGDSNNDKMNMDDLVTYVNSNWDKNIVVFPITDASCFEKKPYFILISVNASTYTRWKRSTFEYLYDFVEHDDNFPQTYTKADITLINNGTLIEFENMITESNVDDQSRIRPSWDQYFMEIARLTARRSNCMKRRVGCVIVLNNNVIATGYNGTPRGMVNCNDGGCERCNKNISGLDLCVCLHAEENALLEVGRDKANGATLYCTTCPCVSCAKKIIQCGIKVVMFSENYHTDEKVKKLFDEGGVNVIGS